MVMELSEREYMVRGLGYLKGIGDIENVVVGASAAGTPVRVAELGRVTWARRCAAASPTSMAAATPWAASW
jgi:Cu/Ag efflux pump CusA